LIFALFILNKLFSFSSIFKIEIWFRHFSDIIWIRERFEPNFSGSSSVRFVFALWQVPSSNCLVKFKYWINTVAASSIHFFQILSWDFTINADSCLKTKLMTFVSKCLHKESMCAYKVFFWSSLSIKKSVSVKIRAWSEFEWVTQTAYLVRVYHMPNTSTIIQQFSQQLAMCLRDR